MNVKKWLKNNTQSLFGKTVAITGSTGGLGEATCFHLAKLGANFIFLNRNIEKSQNLEKRLKESFPNCQIHHIKTDMESISSVKKTAAEIENYNIDYLILNAGTYKILRKKIGEYDNIFQINFLSPYYLTKEMFKINPNIKVVAVGSIAHKGVRLNPKDVALLDCKKDVNLYGNSKRFLMFSLLKLFENKSNLSLVHPGITYTNITSHYPKIFLPIIKFFMKIFFPNTEKASLSIVKGTIDDSKYGYWIGPQYFDIWGIPKEKKLKTFSEEEGDKMFNIAETYYNKNKQD